MIMRSRLLTRSLALFFSALLMVGAVGVVSYAHATPPNNPADYECVLSGVASSDLPGCPNNTGGGVNTSLTYVRGNNISPATCSPAALCGAKSDGKAVTPIVAWGQCYWIDNNGSDSVFVPFKTATEWSDFRSSSPANISFTECSQPTGGSVSVSPPSSYPGPLGAVLVNLPTVYGRADSTVALPASNSTSVWPATPSTTISSFTSNNGATKLTALEQWRGGSASNTAWVPAFIFSPNLIMTATNTTAGGAAGTSITATIGDTITFNYTGTVSTGSITSTVAGGSPSGWSITSGTTSGSSVSGSGSVTVSTIGTQTFTTTTTDSNGLVSVATVTVTVQPLGACGSDGSQSQATAIPLSSAPGNYCQPGNSLVTGSKNNYPEGWDWKCKPDSGGGNRTCYAIQAAKCGSGVQYDASGALTSTSGAPCAKGSTATTNFSSGNYSCTTTMGSATNSVACSASAAPICQPWSW